MSLYGSLAKSKLLSEFDTAAKKAAALVNLGVSAGYAELDLLDGAGAANAGASLACILDGDKRIRNDAADGTAGTLVTAVEYGDGFNRTTMLTLAACVPGAPALGDTAALANGVLIYTFPATGAIVVHSATMSVGISATEAAYQADTPDVGIGTVIGSAAVATLDGTATFEDIITGQTAADSNGTATVATLIPTAAVPLIIATGGTKTVHLNYADTWANGTVFTATVSGTVVLNWTLLPLA